MSPAEPKCEKPVEKKISADCEEAHDHWRIAFADERQRDGADGNTENSERQLHQPKSDIEPARRTITETCGKATVDEDVHLHGTGRDHCRSHQREHGAHAFVAPLKIGAIPVPDVTQ